ncbi:type II toxin-antitoxin system VapC family toxin [Tsukamurella sp. NPDC003166]|uniref:type II toxin-antitoxin system VapC family toxin n=1 Tax=Tsukamurella sp. NPDC003166 TaxID=3154444 RepID=UPI00339F1B50
MAGVAVLDASVLIAFFEEGDPFHPESVLAVTSAIRRGDRLLANELTVAEFLVGAVRSGILDDAEARIAELGVERQEFPPRFAPRLAQIRHDARIKLPDAAVLLTAIEATEHGTVTVSLATFDERLRAAGHAYGVSPAPGTVTSE